MDCHAGWCAIVVRPEVRVCASVERQQGDVDVEDVAGRGVEQGFWDEGSLGYADGDVVGCQFGDWICDAEGFVACGV